MTTSLELVLDLNTAYDTQAQRREAARLLQCDAARIRELRVRKRSLDARGQIRVRLQCDVWLDEDAPMETVPGPTYPSVSGTRRT
ncbi:MAG: hypothetical protein JWN98_627, partial [Abditibacteriota bacterium]|nr:hypothetical protein [Abditibacteriota bacterium]